MYDPDMNFDCGFEVDTDINGNATLPTNALNGKGLTVYCPANGRTERVVANNANIVTNISEKRIRVGYGWDFVMQTHALLGRPGVVPDLAGCEKSVRRLYVNLADTDRLAFAVQEDGRDEPNNVFRDIVHNTYGTYATSGVASFCYGGYRLNPQIVFYAHAPASVHIMGFTAGVTAYIPQQEAR